MIYKNSYPIFLDYWHNKYRNGYSDILFTKIRESKWHFLKHLIYVTRHNRKACFGHQPYFLSWYSTLHDLFLGTRIL